MEIRLMKLIEKNNVKKHASRVVAFMLAAALCFSPVCTSGAKAAGKDTHSSGDAQTVEARAEENQAVEMQADSWRYSGGQIIAEDGAAEDEGLGTAATGKYQLGVDVSYWQGSIDWAKVKADGVDFAIIRCRYGSNKTSNDDSYFKRNVQGCVDNGIPYGVYLYSYATTVSAANDEADHAIRLLQGLSPQLPVYYDLEETSLSAKGSSTVQAIAQAWCSRVQSAGYNAGVYANLNWWKNYIKSGVDAYDKWVAQWSSSCTYTGTYSMWQYTSDERISGISGRVDADWIVTDDTEFLNCDVQETEGYMACSVTSKTGPSGRYADGTTLSWGQKVTVTRSYGDYVCVGTNCWIKSSCLATPDSPKEFVTEEGKQVLKSYAGNTITNQWAVVQDKTYYVGEDGSPLTGSQIIDGVEYYFGEDGVAVSNTFMQVGSKVLYLKERGEISKNTVVKINGYVYGFDSEGSVVKGTWAVLGNCQYYFDAEGRAYISRAKAKKKTTLYKNPGSSKAGKAKKNSRFYILRTSGKWSQRADGLWIRTSYTKKTAVYPIVIPYETAAYKAKLKKKSASYTGPSTSYIKKKTYKKNKKVTVTGLYGSWVKLSSGYWLPKSRLK